MLGKLARWLRILGHNVKYLKDLDDNYLIKLAKSENRILVTRDLQLYQQATKKNLEVILVEFLNYVENLAFLSKKLDFNLEIDLENSRCPKCNGKLNEITKERIIDRIPKKTLNNFKNFWLCNTCNQIYWQGSHWKKINSTINKANIILNKKKST
jgi:hypothetical protein